MQSLANYMNVDILRRKWDIPDVISNLFLNPLGSLWPVWWLRGKFDDTRVGDTIYKARMDGKIKLHLLRGSPLYNSFVDMPKS